MRDFNLLVEKLRKKADPGELIRGKILLHSLTAVLSVIFAAGTVLAANDSSQAGQQELKVALVIGNSKYHASPLINPVNDSRSVAAKLRDLGFQVIEREDLLAKQIPSTLREFRASLKPGAVALFFYAGHGLQIKGNNYLPAVDATITSEEDVPMSSIDLNNVLDILEEAKTRLNLVFLDACRNNPFTRSFRSQVGGLAKVTAPSGTLISFATRPGSVASDGNKHGLYTEHLLKAMDRPHVQIEQVLKSVVSGVKKDSQGQQEPWMEGSIEGDFYFQGAPNPEVTASEATISPMTVELAFWESVRNSRDLLDLQAYLDKYPDGQFASLAKARIESLGADGARKPVVNDVVARADVTRAVGPRKLVAIAGFENKSTYGADKLWDTSGQFLTSNLLEMGVFRLVEWEKMKQLFDYKALSTNSLVKSPTEREAARKILLTEYFLSGAVTQYDVSQKSEVSAMSKRKTYVTNVRVDLQLQDSATGEYVSGANGEATEKQEFNGDFSGGQTGTWDPKSGDKALNQAIRTALQKLINNYRIHQDED